MYTRIVALSLIACASLAAACSTLQAAKDPALRFVDCVTDAFEPLVGTRERAAEVVRDIEAGRVEVLEVLDAYRATEAQAKALRDALSACTAAIKAETRAELKALQSDAGVL